MKNACIMDFCIHSNTLTSGTWCPNSFHILASLTIRCLRSLRSDTNFLKLKRRRIIYDQNCHICKIVSTEDLQYVQCISLLVRGESGDSHLYQQGPNGGPQRSWETKQTEYIWSVDKRWGCQSHKITTVGPFLGSLWPQIRILLRIFCLQWRPPLLECLLHRGTGY